MLDSQRQEGSTTPRRSRLAFVAPAAALVAVVAGAVLRTCASEPAKPEDSSPDAGTEDVLPKQPDSAVEKLTDQTSDAGDGVPEMNVVAPAKKSPKTIGEACQGLVDGEKRGSDGVDIALEQFGDMFGYFNPDLHAIRERCNFREDELRAALTPALQRGDEGIGALVADDIRASCRSVDEPIDPFDPDNPRVIEYNARYSTCDELPIFSPQEACRFEHLGYRMESCRGTRFSEGPNRDACEVADKAREESDCTGLSTEAPYRTCVDRIDEVDNPEREAREIEEATKENEEFEACAKAEAAKYGVGWDFLRKSGGD